MAYNHEGRGGRGGKERREGGEGARSKSPGYRSDGNRPESGRRDGVYDGHSTRPHSPKGRGESFFTRGMAAGGRDDRAFSRRDKEDGAPVRRDGWGAGRAAGRLPERDTKPTGAPPRSGSDRPFSRRDKEDGAPVRRDGWGAAGRLPERDRKPTGAPPRSGSDRAFSRRDKEDGGPVRRDGWGAGRAAGRLPEQDMKPTGAPPRSGSDRAFSRRDKEDGGSVRRDGWGAGRAAGRLPERDRKPTGAPPRSAAPSPRPVPSAVRDAAPPVFPQERSAAWAVAADASPMVENILAGRNPIREAMKAGRPMEKLLVQRGELSGSARQIVAWAHEARVVVQYVEKARLDQIYAGHQGLIAFVSAAEYKTVDDILRYAREKGEEAFVIVLDSITDPHNLGAIIRTAECAGAHGVILPERRSAGLNPAAVKASAGACEYQRIAKVTNLSRVLDELKQRGLWVVGADTEGEPVRGMDLKGPVALVIGAEGEGISALLKKKCDRLAALPIRGRIESLNASVAAGVLMYEIMRQRDEMK